MESYKVIFTGPVGAGKTSAVKTVTDHHPVLTDAIASDITSQRKPTTTVAMDYGVLRLDDTKQVHVYGTPGQDRFDFMRDILIKGGNGLIILLDNSRNNPYRDLKYYAAAFSNFIRQGNTIIGITHSDKPGPVSIDAYRQWAIDLNITSHVFPVDARNKQDMLFLIAKVLEKPDTVSVAQPVTTTILNNQPDERQRLTATMLDKVSGLNGITGASLCNLNGEILQSSIQDEVLNETILLLSGLVPTIESSNGQNNIQRIMLKSIQEENLMIFMEKNQSLGISSHPKISLSVLGQQIEDILQWV